MEGVGHVFGSYRDGLLEDDDEAAHVHVSQEHDYRLLSEAMVNIRQNLQRAEEAKVIKADTHQIQRV